MRFSRRTITDESDQIDERWYAYQQQSVTVLPDEDPEIELADDFLLIRPPFAEPEPSKGFFSLGQSLRYLGLAMGTLPIFIIIVILLFQLRRDPPPFDIAFLLVLGLIGLIMAIVGFLVGRSLSASFRLTFDYSWPRFIFTNILWGIFCGAVTGGAGGPVIAFVGAIPGAMLGAFLGMFAMPLFASLVRLYKNGDEISIFRTLSFAAVPAMLLVAFILGRAT